MSWNKYLWKPACWIGLAACLLLSACSAGALPTATPTQEQEPTAQATQPPEATALPGPLETPIPSSAHIVPTAEAALVTSLDPDQGSVIAFETILEGASFTGERAEPLFLALRAGEGAQTSPPGLPVELQHALQAALDKQGPALYILLYGGEKPSGGFSMQIESLTLHQVEGQGILLVRYRVAGPSPDQGAAAVLTYPYLLARVETEVPVNQVRFEEAAQ